MSRRYWAVLFCLLIPASAAANEDALERIAPQSPIITGVITCGADDGTDYAEVAGAGTDADDLLIPDGYTFTVSNLTADSFATCALFDSNEVLIGDQSAATTRTDIDDAADSPNGDGQGQFMTVFGSSSMTATVDRQQMIQQFGYRNGICAVESTLSSRYSEDGNFSLYAPCGDADECNGDASTPASTACEEDVADIRTLLRAKPGPKLTGQYFACRCSVAAELNVTVWAKTRQNSFTGP